MRVAVVKQLLDVFGPWSTVAWSSPLELLERWPGKLVYWEMSCVLEADWYVIPQQTYNAYTLDSVLRHAGRAEFMARWSTHVVPLRSVPFEQYDVVISMDAILPDERELRECSALLCYYVQEHWDPQYKRSLRRPQAPYDVFLDHMLAVGTKFSGLRRAIGFPYLQSEQLVRAFVGPRNAANVILVDARTLMTLAMVRVVCRCGVSGPSSAGLTPITSGDERSLQDRCPIWDYRSAVLG